MIIGQNTLLNQYVPTFLIKDVVDGQTLVYDKIKKAYTNKNATGLGNNTFVGLNDTAKPSLPGGYVQWNSTGNQLVYSTTIPAASITGLELVAMVTDLIDVGQTLVVGPRRQYIVAGSLEVLGNIENNGRIVIL